MVLASFVVGLMVGGTVGVLVSALCLAAWRSDASTEAADARMAEADAALSARDAALVAASPPAPVGARGPVLLADLPVPDLPRAQQLPMAAGVPGTSGGEER